MHILKPVVEKCTLDTETETLLMVVGMSTAFGNAHSCTGSLDWELPMDI